MKKLSLLFIILLFALSLGCHCARFSFVVMGDNREGDVVFKDLIKKVNKDKDVRFIVSTGDFTLRGTEAEYEKYWKMCRASKVKIYEAMGNHDIGFFNTGVKLFKEKYDETYYYFDRYGARFIVIDNSRSKGLGRKQFTWLKDALDTTMPKFVFMHKPIFDPTGTYPYYIMTPKEDNESLNRLLVRAGVKYVFFGHIHGYGRAEKDGIVYILTAGGGAPLYLPAFGGGYYHYVKVTVDGLKIYDKVVRIYND